MSNSIKINPIDNVEVLLSSSDIAPAGHKIALSDINKGESIIKYGCVIGSATKSIKKGEWVHTHNMKTNLSEETKISFLPYQNTLEKTASETVNAFVRPDGKIGIRNEIWIIPTVGCVNDTVKKIASDNQDLVSGSIDGLYAFTHPYGCSQTGEDHNNTKKLLASLCHHPNAGGVLVVHLGCENLQHSEFKAELGEYDSNKIKFITCQDEADEFKKAREMLLDLTKYVSAYKREKVPVSELVIGLKCGGSDGLSGITANPVIGKFSDILCSQGGTTVLSEVPEMFGAESILLSRCENEDIFNKGNDMINNFKNYFVSHNETVYENPSPGNKNGGITTLEDKSCGCVQKGGTSPIKDIIYYGERVKTKGLNLLYGPGNDLVSATALTAVGAHIVLFSTGRGTPFGAPAPTVKISTNTPLFSKKQGWIDFNAGTVADGVDDINTLGERLFSFVLDIANGKKTKNEVNNFREIAIFKDGVTL